MAQTGVFEILTKTVQLGSPWTLSSPNLIVTLPDGTISSGIVPTVTPPGTTSTDPHTFTYLYVPESAGPYNAYFEFVYDLTSQTLKVPFAFWVTWTDVYTGVCDLLGVNKNDTFQRKFDLTFRSIYDWLYDFSQDTLPAYKDFTPAYQEAFDRAMTYLVSSWLRPSLGGKNPTGEIILFKKGTTTVQYANGVLPSTITLEQRWWDAGMQILDANIPEIAFVFDNDRTGDMTMTRGEQAPGNRHPNAGWYVDSRQGSIVMLGQFWARNANQLSSLSHGIVEL